MSNWGRAEHSIAYDDEISDADTLAFEKEHPILDGMRENTRLVWDKLSDKDKISIYRDRAYWYRYSKGYVAPLIDLLGFRTLDGAGGHGGSGTDGRSSLYKNKTRTASDATSDSKQ